MRKSWAVIPESMSAAEVNAFMIRGEGMPSDLRRDDPTTPQAPATPRWEMDPDFVARREAARRLAEETRWADLVGG